MKILFSLISVGLIPIFVGCVSLTPEEISYQKKFTAQPTEFELPKAAAGRAWARALDFVYKYSDMKIESSSDSMIKTYLPPLGKYGYSIMRTEVGEKVMFVVQCLGELPPIPDNNAHIAALYIAAGTEPLPGTLGDCFHVSCKKP
jgi:hypothetical protein